MPTTIPLSHPVTETAESLLRKAERTEREAHAQRQQADEAIVKAQKLQERLAQLQREVDKAAERIIRADAEHAALKLQLESWLTDLLRGYGLVNGYGENLRSPDYSGVADTREKLQHFPQVQKYLAGELAQAERNLRDFQTANR